MFGKLKKQPEAPTEASASTRDAAHDPYAAAKREHNAVFGDKIIQAKNWRFFALGMMVIAAVAVFGLVRAATQSKFIPYIVEVDELGAVAAVGVATRVNTTQDERLVRAFLNRFVMDVRGVSVDPTTQRDAISRVFSMLGSATSGHQKVSEMMAENNPFRRAAEVTVAVEVRPLLRISDQTWQATWRETTRDHAGQVLEARDWRGTFTVAFNPPSDETQVLLNPLGLYVVDLDWRQEIGR